MRWRDLRVGDCFVAPEDHVDLAWSGPYVVLSVERPPRRPGVVAVRVLLPTGATEEWTGRAEMLWYGDVHVGSLQLVAPR